MGAGSDALGDSGVHVTPLSDVQSVLLATQPLPQTQALKGMMLPVIECNHMSLDEANGVVWLAGGDACAYGYALDRLGSAETAYVHRLPTSASHTSLGAMADAHTHSDYLHCLAVASQAQLLCTGGEDGKVGLWDIRASKSAGVMSPPTGAKEGDAAWVSGLEVDTNGNWMMCSGGVERAVSSVRGCVVCQCVCLCTRNSAAIVRTCVHVCVCAGEV